MFSSLIIFLQLNVIPLGAMGVFSASIIEEVIAPIPSALVILTSGFLFLTGLSGVALVKALIFKIVIAAALGISLGSLLVYGLAYFFGKPFIEKWGKWFGITWNDIESAKKKFSQRSRSELSLFSVRAIPVLPSAIISAFCGLIRLKVSTYLIWTFLGTIVRVSILALIGFQVGSLYATYAEVINRFENQILIFAVLIAVVFVAVRIRRKRTAYSNTNK